MPDEVQREPSRRHDFALCGLPILPMVLGNITLAMTPTSRRSRFTEVHCIRLLIDRAPLERANHHPRRAAAGQHQ